MENKYVVVIGGLNLDIAGLSGPIYRDHDSNIGEVTISVGGVGQNIAANLIKLGVPTYLISVYGDDHFGVIAEAECKKNGINLDYAEKLENTHSSIYLYVNDNEGDMVTGVNDMKITERITPDFLAPKLDFINKAEIVVVDTNLQPETMNWIGANVTAPIFIDTVSASKADRVLGMLSSIDTIKPNMYEAMILTGVEVHDESTARMAASELIGAGVKNVCISLGADGILCASKDNAIVATPMVRKIVSTNGCGDCTMATLVWSRFNFGSDLPLEQVGLYTQAAASITLESAMAVAPELCSEEVLKRAAEGYKPKKERYRAIKQIYSIRNYNEAVQVMDAGANHIGLVPQQTGGVPAHRVPYDVVDKIFAECRRRGVKAVAIMLNKDPDEIIYITKKIQPDILHVAGMEFTADKAFADRLHAECPGVKLMQAVLVDGPEAVDRAKEYAEFCDFILTDSGLAKDTGIGASGLTHDWSIDAEIVRSVNVPVIIAGGLGPDNVEQCIREIRPYGVDSLTKTSFKFDDGVLEKDIPAVKKFCELVDKICKEIDEENA